MIRGEKELKEMSDFSNAFLMADIAYHYIHTRIICTQTYTRDALGPSKISARRNDNRLSDNESPLSPPLPSHVLKPTLCHALSVSTCLFLARISFLSAATGSKPSTFTYRRTNFSQHRYHNDKLD